MWENSPKDPELLEALRTKLTETNLPLFKDTILSLLSERPPFTNLNIVEKVYCFAESPFFKSFGIKELQLIALGAQEVYYDNKQVIYDKNNPAKFYINSAPAHKSYKTVKIEIKDAGFLWGRKLSEVDAAIVIDAVDWGGKPGSIIKAKLEELDIGWAYEYLRKSLA